jgi:hypothetical protein
MLTPFIGIDSNGKPKIYMSPFSLYRLSPMHLRGVPIPKKVEQLMDGDEDVALDALKLMQKYYNDYNSKKKKK